MINHKNWLEGIFEWREKHIPHKQFVYLLSFLIGIVGSLAAVILKNAVHLTHKLLTRELNVENINFLYLAYPLIGIILTVLFVRMFVRDNIGHGITRVLHSISKNNSKLKAHHCFSSLVASTLTVGFGGSVGLEAPIVLTGSSIGSNLGRFFKLNYKTMTILIGCGAAGAIAGIFKAPVAAVIFGLEVLMLDLTMWSLIPLLISAVTGTTVSYLFLGKDVIFTFAMKDPFLLKNIPYYIVLGIFTGLLSVYFTRGALKMESIFDKIKNPVKKIVVGGILLGIMILLFPPLYGEGYNTLNSLLNGNANEITNQSFFYRFQDNFWIMSLFLCMILFFKVIAMASTTGSGGVGGIFAPSLFMGGVAGFFVSRLLNLFDFIHVSERNFALTGMAGVMAGVMHAPLTAIFLIAEITGGYALFIPLIITATISYITIKYFEPHSIYTTRLAKRGELITHHKDKAILTLLEMEKIIETDFIAVAPDNTLTELTKAIAKSKRNIFPVLNKDGMLVGIVLLDNIRHIMFNQDMHQITYVRDIMILPPTFVSPDEPMEEVMQKFEENNVWNLPVIRNGRYIGFLSKSKIFSVYRKWLLDISEE
ncbi:MAG: chloride channel protein [Bacteroidales bacterium]|nr:chloride channel protein [Bacteroidales bacterium]